MGPPVPVMSFPFILRVVFCEKKSEECPEHQIFRTTDLVKYLGLKCWDAMLRACVYRGMANISGQPYY
jgi:hypothetical protein